MKNKIKTAMIASIVLVGLAFTVSSCQKEAPANALAENEINQKAVTSDCNCIIDPADTVTQAEIDMLTFMREEEKLARDVYIAMSELYPQPIFRNIAKSEQHHMDQVLCLLQYYNIPDPASADTGVFTNGDLQELYNTLIGQGSESLIGALTAGATIEDKDIADLEQDMTESENPAILNIFDRLACASGNHIRSFSANLTFHGETYTPQFLSQEEYTSIISLPHQFCGAPATGQAPGNISQE